MVGQADLPDLKAQRNGCECSDFRLVGLECLILQDVLVFHLSICRVIEAKIVSFFDQVCHDFFDIRLIIN